MINEYQKFVLSTTSRESKSVPNWNIRQDILYSQNMNVPLLCTSSIGMSSEVGEFNEIVKKIFFQGKEYTEDERYHMKRELGDILWYLTNAATALHYSLEEIIEENISKLEARYPDGFRVHRSENRSAGDI